MSQPSGNPMYVVGIITLVVVALYFAFMGINGAGLAEHEGTATVVEKGYREAGTTYYTQVIDGRSFVRQQATPEAYLLKLDLDGKNVESVVAKELHDALNVGDRVQVVYQRRRITGVTQVVNVSR